jgi:DNA-binding transcriptional ArsR family regulator
MVIHMANQSASLDAAFHALADPTRRAVVSRLMRGPAPVTELAEPFGMRLPSFMKHLKVLEGSGLIRSRKHGRVRMCEVRMDRMTKTQNWFDQQRAIWKSRYENLDSLLEKLSGDEGEA